MMYCTKCGSDLKGSKTQCPVCRYPVEKMKSDLARPREYRRTPDTAKPWAPPIPDQRDPSKRRPSGRSISSDEKVARILEGPAEVEEEDEDDYYKPESSARRSYVSLGDDISEPAGEEEEEVSDPTIVEGGCSVCGSRPDRRCFFCLSPVCTRHTVNLKIFVRKMPFGGKVESCPSCANKRHGRNPTVSEAQEAGMYFSIKPYHEWRKV
ncbi:MAG: hypothetical protein ACMUIG_10505 [Thermoplasmatota archaeon]